jgi:hypothetical protein
VASGSPSAEQTPNLPDASNRLKRPPKLDIPPPVEQLIGDLTTQLQAMNKAQQQAQKDLLKAMADMKFVALAAESEKRSAPAGTGSSRPRLPKNLVQPVHVKGTVPVMSASGMPSEEPDPPFSTKVYAVAKGRETGIFTSWKRVLTLISGFPFAKYKRFTNKPEAEAWLVEQLSPLQGLIAPDEDLSDDEDASVYGTGGGSKPSPLRLPLYTLQQTPAQATILSIFRCRLQIHPSANRTRSVRFRLISQPPLEIFYALKV